MATDWRNKTARPRFRVGQVWRTRGGGLAEIEFILNKKRTRWPVLLRFSGENSYIFAVSTFGNFTYPSEPHQFDLVELVK